MSVRIFGLNIIVIFFSRYGLFYRGTGNLRRMADEFMPALTCGRIA
jgi:hypothetical protein